MFARYSPPATEPLARVPSSIAWRRDPSPPGVTRARTKYRIPFPFYAGWRSPRMFTCDVPSFAAHQASFGLFLLQGDDCLFQVFRFRPQPGEHFADVHSLKGYRAPVSQGSRLLRGRRPPGMMHLRDVRFALVPKQLGMDVVTLVRGGFVHFHLNAVRIRPSVLADAGDLPGHLDPRPAGFNGKA